MSASDSTSATWVNIIPAATQVIPSIGLDGKPTTSAAPSEDNGGDTFPLAAVAVIAIIAGVVALFVGYKLYKWSLRRRASEGDYPDLLPETRGLKSPLSPGGGGFATLPSSLSLAHGGHSMGRRSESGFGMARSRQASWGGDSWGGGYPYSSEKGDLTPSPPFAGTPLPPGTPTSREGSPGPVGANGSHGSLANFPSSGNLPSSSTRGSLGPQVPRRSYYSSASVPQLLHSRTISSFSSSPMLGGSPSVGPGGITQYPSGNRLAGAPHNPHSRIEVVPPLPLAPPPGTVIATGRSELDFAPSSGIGKDGQAVGGAEEWLNIVETAGQNGDAQERLNPAFDGAYHTTVSQSSFPQLQQQYPAHSFPPAPSSSGGSSRSSSAAPPPPGQRRPGGRASGSNLRGGPSNPQLASVARQQQQAASMSAAGSANSSDSNISSSSSGPSRRAPPPLAINTSAVAAPVINGQGLVGDEPRSPLENLQRRMEREMGSLGGSGAGEATIGDRSQGA
ncbi:hypothetical protein JCM11251_003372 [Rhodosporidiobolus azoricus]